MSDTDSMSEQFEDTQELLEEGLRNMQGTITSFLDQTAALLEASYRPTYPAVAPRSPLRPRIGPSVKVNTLEEEFGTRVQPTPRYPDSPIYAVTMASGSTEQSNARSKLLLPSQLSFHVGNDPVAHVNEFLAMVAPLLLEDEALIEIFSCYLFGRADIWFHRQCGGKFYSFCDLTTRFIDHFSTNAGLPEITPQGPEESSWSFMGRWADAGGTSLTEEDQIKTVLSHLNYEYKTAMATQSYSTLGELIFAGRRIDEMTYGHIPSTVRHVKINKYDVGPVSTAGAVSDFNHSV